MDVLNYKFAWTFLNIVSNENESRIPEKESTCLLGGSPLRIGSVVGTGAAFHGDVFHCVTLADPIRSSNRKIKLPTAGLLFFSFV